MFSIMMFGICNSCLYLDDFDDFASKVSVISTSVYRSTFFGFFFGGEREQEGDISDLLKLSKCCFLLFLSFSVLSKCQDKCICAFSIGVSFRSLSLSRRRPLARSFFPLKNNSQWSFLVSSLSWLKFTFWAHSHEYVIFFLSFF